MVFGGGCLLLAGADVGNLSAEEAARWPWRLYSLAAVLPYGLICLWLWRAGVWEQFWFWTVEYASKYVQNVPLSLALDLFSFNFWRVAAWCWPLWLLALAGVAGVAILASGKPGVRSFVFGWLAFSFFCVCPGFYFRPHYFIVMLPAVAMLAGVGCRLLWDLACGRFWLRRAAASAKNHSPAPAARRKRRGIEARPSRGATHITCRIRAVAGAGGPRLAGGCGLDVIVAK